MFPLLWQSPVYVQSHADLFSDLAYKVNYHDTNKLIRVGGVDKKMHFHYWLTIPKKKTLAIAESHAHQEKTHGAVPGTESEISNPGPISRHTKYGQHGE